MYEKRQELFEQNVPKFTEAEFKVALEQKRYALSFNKFEAFTVTTAGGFLGIKFALANNKSEIIVIDRFLSEILRGLLNDLNSQGWMPNPETPTPH